MTMTICISTDVSFPDFNVLYLGTHTIPMTHQDMLKTYHLLHNTLFGMDGYNKEGEYVLLVEKKQ